VKRKDFAMNDDTPNDSERREPVFSDPAGGERAPGASEADATQPPEPSKRVGELEAEVTRLKDQALRALAEAENTRRRAQREIDENNKYAVSNIARDILPVADNLRRALEGLSTEARQADERLDKFATGVELTEREFLSALERHHIKRVDPLGEPFDHNLHQAVMQVEGTDKPAGTVVQVLQPGYTIHGRLLRPAMVAVAKGNATAGQTVDTTA
jgi:molecular chaperone GrpE